MAIRGVAIVDIGVEVNKAYKSEAASWFSSVGASKTSVKLNEDEEDEITPKKILKTKCSSSKKEKTEEKQKGTKQVKFSPHLLSFMDEKISKKLKKSKWKAEQKQKDEEEQIDGGDKESRMSVNNEEDSKTKAVKKKSKTPDSTPVHTEESLLQRLASDTLSQSTRKRLRKRLNKLIRERNGTDGENRGEQAKALSQSSQGTNVTHGKESPAAKRKHTVDAPEEEEGSPPAKKKKKKKRSKQKNIRKDNRPDHLKPPHLRQNTSDTSDSSLPGTEENYTKVKPKVKVETDNLEVSTAVPSPNKKLAKKRKAAKIIAENDTGKHSMVKAKPKVDEGISTSRTSLAKKLSEEKRKRLKKRVKKLSKLSKEEETAEVRQPSGKKVISDHKHGNQKETTTSLQTSTKSLKKKKKKSLSDEV